MNDRHPMTPQGYKRLQEELRHHKEVLRPKIVRDIEEARAHGDISENSEYEDAKHRQGLCEARIREVETKLALAEVIEVKSLPPSDRVVFGVTVVLEDLESEEEVRYRIVGVDEADVRAGLISIQSPIARALVGKSIGDESVVQVPGGTRRFAITAVEYE
jgi:transcription elongation factor GreA